MSETRVPETGRDPSTEMRKHLHYREEVRMDDTGAVRRIVASSGFFSPDEVEVAVELVETRLSSGSASGYYFLFAESDAEPVGYTCFGPIPCTKFSFDLYWIAVLDKLRAVGIGKELLSRTEKIIADLGGKRIYIETSSRELYEPTRAFYRRCGYKQEAVLSDFYGPGDHKIIFLKVFA